MILDTNALSAWREGESSLAKVIARRQPLLLPVIVIGEYLDGLESSRYRVPATDWLNGLLDGTAARPIPIDVDTSRAYAAVRSRLRAIGHPIPVNDQWIAALCLQHDVPIVSRDQHFDAVDGLQRIEW